MNNVMTRLCTGFLSIALAGALLPAAALADTGTETTSGTDATSTETGTSDTDTSGTDTDTATVIDDDSTTEVDPYATTPNFKYRVDGIKSKAKTIKDGSKHSIGGGLGKIKVYAPTSSVKGGTISGGVTYSIKTKGAKTKTAKKAGKWIGSTSSKKVENAFKLRLTGTVSKHYNVYYRVSVSKLGWTGWAKNGQWAGTAHKLRIKGVQIKLVKKGKAAPGETAAHYIAVPSVKYQVRSTKGGWTSYKKNGKVAGKAKRNVGIKQIRAKVSSTLPGGIKYRVLTRKGKWTKWTSGKAGINKKSSQARAIRIKLTGKLAKKYNVYYTTYAEDYNWLGWAKNGEKSGTKFKNVSLGALKVKVVLKGTSAPGSTSGNYVTKKLNLHGRALIMYRKAQKYSSPTKWLILLDYSNCRVAVFHGSKGSWKLKRFIVCSPGSYSTPTVRGTFYVGSKSYSFGEEKGYSCYYATQIYGNYLFHSILYYANTHSVMDGTLGAHVSHGCVRMAIGNAKYIYYNVPSGSKIVSY